MYNVWYCALLCTTVPMNVCGWRVVCYWNYCVDCVRFVRLCAVYGVRVQCDVFCGVCSVDCVLSAVLSNNTKYIQLTHLTPLSTSLHFRDSLWLALLPDTRIVADVFLATLLLLLSCVTWFFPVWPYTCCCVVGVLGSFRSGHALTTPPTQTWYASFDAIIGVYDVTNANSRNNLDSWCAAAAPSFLFPTSFFFSYFPSCSPEFFATV